MSYESVKKSRSKKLDKQDESGLSKNHSKSVRYRLRVQQEQEAENEIKEYKDDLTFEEYYEREHEGKSI